MQVAKNVTRIGRCIEMFGQLLPEQANAPDSATIYGFAGPSTSGPEKKRR
jgi:hypothetical protein